MARPEVTGRKTARTIASDEVDAFSVAEFCTRHRISVQLFYKNRSQHAGALSQSARAC